ncbi:hypothetical protein ABH968_004757 [Lysinibacillus sp. RC79]
MSYNVDVGLFFFLGAGTRACSVSVSEVFSAGLTTVLTSKNTPYTLTAKPVRSKNICTANGRLIRMDTRIIKEPLPQIKAALVNELKGNKPPSQHALFIISMPYFSAHHHNVGVIFVLTGRFARSFR